MTGGAKTGGDGGVRLRPMAEDDLVRAAEWMRAPHVVPFWSHDVDVEIADMRDELVNGGTTTYRITTLDDRPVGLVFWYRIHDYPEYADELRGGGVDVPPGAWSMDYVIGEADAVGRGVGTAMLRAARDEIFATEPDASCLIVPVHADNERSWRLLERVGFTRLPGTIELTPDNDVIDERHIVSRLDRVV